jgi:hypothetical protein
MLLSVNQISKLTGRDRHGIPKRLETLPFTPGDKGAHLYESREAAVFPPQNDPLLKAGTMVRTALWLITEVGVGNSFTKEKHHPRFSYRHADTFDKRHWWNVLR